MLKKKAVKLKATKDTPSKFSGGKDNVATTPKATGATNENGANSISTPATLVTPSTTPMPTLLTKSTFPPMQSSQTIQSDGRNTEAAAYGRNISLSKKKISNAPKLSTKSTTIKNEDDRPKENPLTTLLPGYTAPMKLEVKSLQGKTGLSLSQLRSRAEGSNGSTIPSGNTSAFATLLNKQNEAPFDSSSSRKSASFLRNKSIKAGKKIQTSFTTSFQHQKPRQQSLYTKSGWFNMTPNAQDSTQLKTDLTLLRNRNYLDPKKFYKSLDSFDNKVLQVGTVIEGSAEYYSARLTRRERKGNLTEEWMGDGDIRGYAKRKYGEIQNEKESKRGRLGNKGYGKGVRPKKSSR